jgi:hypothetical protein
VSEEAKQPTAVLVLRDRGISERASVKRTEARRQMLTASDSFAVIYSAACDKCWKWKYTDMY